MTYKSLPESDTRNSCRPMAKLLVLIWIGSNIDNLSLSFNPFAN
jgi:hypothetical protein